VSLIKAMILSYAMDPTLSLDALVEAFQAADDEERKDDADSDRPRREPCEPDDPGVQNLRAAFWV